VVSPFPSFGEGGVAESRGGRWIHNVDNKRFMHSPTTSPLRVLLLPEGGELQILSTINCLAIIFLINFVSKSDKELSVSFISYSISFIPSPVSFNLLYSFLIRCNQV
jgi:hypothetical protein